MCEFVRPLSVSEEGSTLLNNMVYFDRSMHHSDEKKQFAFHRCLLAQYTD